MKTFALHWLALLLLVKGDRMSSTQSGAVKPKLSVRRIRKSFRLNTVLKDINLDVYPGNVVALIGGNGAGKSTLMKIIMGIYKQDDGDIAIDGVKADLPNPAAALSRGIYLVPQEPMLFPNMSVEENITIGFTEKRRISVAVSPNSPPR